MKVGATSACTSVNRILVCAEATARRLSGLLQDDSQAALVRARISAHTQAVRQRLQSAVGELAAH